MSLSIVEFHRGFLLKVTGTFYSENFYSIHVSYTGKY